MREIGAFEAKNKFGQLLDLAERGEEVLITRHGKEVARLVPARPARAPDSGPRGAAAAPRPGGSAPARPLRLAGMEGLPRRGPPMTDAA